MSCNCASFLCLFRENAYYGVLAKSHDNCQKGRGRCKSHEHDVAEVNGSDPPMLPGSFLDEKEPGYEATLT